MERPDSHQVPADVGTEVDQSELEVSLTTRTELCEVWLERDEPGEQPLVSVGEGQVEDSEASSVGQVQVVLETFRW